MGILPISFLFYCIISLHYSVSSPFFSNFQVGSKRKFFDYWDFLVDFQTLTKYFRDWLTWLILQCLLLLWFSWWYLTLISIIATIHVWVKNTSIICILLWSYALKTILLPLFSAGSVIYPAWYCSPIWLIVSWFGNVWNSLSHLRKKGEFWLEKKDTLQENSKKIQTHCLKIT